MSFSFSFELPDCPRDSINCLSFSADGRRLAAAGEDGRVYIYPLDSPGYPLKAHYPVAVTSIQWAEPGTCGLFIGLANGNLHLLLMDGISCSLQDKFICNMQKGDVTALAYDLHQENLGLGLGDLVYILDMSRLNAGVYKVLSRIEPRGFTDGGPLQPEYADGNEVRLISFFNGGSIRDLKSGCDDWVRPMEHPHVIIPRLTGLRYSRSCAINENGTFLAIFTLEQGFCVYDIRQRRCMGPATLPNYGESVVLPAVFSSEELVLGAMDGNVKVIDLSSSLTEIETLSHGVYQARILLFRSETQLTCKLEDDVVQALAMFETRDGLKRFLATGCAERSDRTYVRIWICKKTGDVRAIATPQAPSTPVQSLVPVPNPASSVRVTEPTHLAVATLIGAVISALFFYGASLLV
ncbi:hypothetical protein FA13DRAFT_1714416 [Coprinellus micaceus]|uniref:WD40 repeat-like protein n=1 Tax=Coprinellus micaceus TaxID=71717 RepID=A0A4Y7SSS3_COPMI|nr:hypothetical protein FA13DRAFT_1714416 [Coprinellus micaceus]